MPEVSPDDLFVLASLAHSKWSEAFDNRKTIKTATWESQGKFCPKAEWPKYHAGMIEAAEAEFLKWDAMLKRLTPLLPKL